jgi:exonuclease VII small subunit
MEPVSEELLAQLPIEKGAGLILKSVVPDSPAARAGLQKNDVIVKLDDQLLINSNQLSALIQMKKDGEKVRLTYFRGGKSSTAEAQIQMHQEDYTGSTFVSGGTLTFSSPTLDNLPRATVDKHGNDLGEMVVVDKDGHVLITKTQPDLGAVTAQVEKILRAAGVDDKTITQTELAIAEAAKATSSAASSIGNAAGDAASQIKNAKDQVAKSLEKARAAAEQAQKKVEEARERVEKQLEKRGDQTKAPTGQESKAPAAQ